MFWNMIAKDNTVLYVGELVSSNNIIPKPDHQRRNAYRIYLGRVNFVKLFVKIDLNQDGAIFRLTLIHSVVVNKLRCDKIGDIFGSLKFALVEMKN